MAFSPDGTRIVSGSEDNTLRLWDASTGQPIGAPLQGHEDAVNSVAFSPDGTRIVSGSEDKTLRLWDASTGQPIGAPLQGHEHGVTSVAFSPDGTRIVSGSEDKTLRLWDASTGQPIGAPLQGHEERVYERGLQPRRHAHRLRQRGQDPAPVGRQHGPAHRRAAAGASRMRCLAWPSAPTARASSPAVRTRPCACGTPARASPSARRCRGIEDAVTSVAFSPDGTRIVSGSGDKTLRLWDASTGQPIGAPLQGHRGGGE